MLSYVILCYDIIFVIFYRLSELLVPILMLLMGVMIYVPGSTAYIFEKCFPPDEFNSIDPQSTE